MKQLLFLSGMLLCTVLFAQVADVQHYRYDLELSDQSDSIRGLATIQFRPQAKGNLVQFDLGGIAGNRGMQVRSVSAAGKNLSFTHHRDQLVISFPGQLQAGSNQEVVIRYGGVPADGLIISRNKYGDRTFFSDNWPNRAHQWIPCNDRPDDKATVTFSVTAPVHYQVISNGLQQEESNLPGNLKRTVWHEATPIPTKVMVIGAARMAVGYLDTAVGVPVTAWVYPQDRDKGFRDYALTKDMLRFFSAYVGPYAFQKLANVQSKTIFGGMENASAIFYGEETLTGDGASEDLMAHEVAHQWFGNTVSEQRFAHLWLSEGFATYLTNIYLEHKYGPRKLMDRLMEERQAVIDFSRKNKSSVVNETGDLMSLLNANSYQKGGWVLHMLRREVGDTLFRQVLQEYYRSFAGGNAGTRDFQRIAETVSRRRLDAFFDQWLYQPGVPRFSITWRYAKGGVQLQLQQTGETLYTFPLELALVDAAGKQTLHRIQVDKIKENFTLPAKEKPTIILLDPNVNLLFEGTIRD